MVSPTLLLSAPPPSLGAVCARARWPRRKRTCQGSRPRPEPSHDTTYPGAAFERSPSAAISPARAPRFVRSRESGVFLGSAGFRRRRSLARALAPSPQGLPPSSCASHHHKPTKRRIQQTTKPSTNTTNVPPPERRQRARLSDDPKKASPSPPHPKKPPPPNAAAHARPRSRGRGGGPPAAPAPPRGPARRSRAPARRRARRPGGARYVSFTLSRDGGPRPLSTAPRLGISPAAARGPPPVRQAPRSYESRRELSPATLSAAGKRAEALGRAASCCLLSTRHARVARRRRRAMSQPLSGGSGTPAAANPLSLI